MELNNVIAKLPRHLLNLIIDQDYDSYTAQDHSVWRYVMRQNLHYLPKVAHHSYLEGLHKAGIDVDRIPNMNGMNRILKKIGWAAVAVDGFIPPAAFMEFQAYNVLVIAADIRPIDQIEYTPAPDIIHEAAGHAPIIADPDYAEYLRLFGEIGHKAFSSAHDYKMYEAIRHLSILKADPYSPKEDIIGAERSLAILEEKIDGFSEMSLIRNLHWWTVEYGLVGDLINPKIYGAGLLSSIGESYSSLKPDVKKVPYTIDAANQGFDITTRQPQLFVTPSFEHLSNVLDEFACSMALRRGGLYGISKAIESQNIATVEYSSGLQVSGVFNDVMENDGNPVYIKTNGPTALSFRNKQLEGHGKSYHESGFGSPVGKLADQSKPLEYMNASELEDLNIMEGNSLSLEFESGVKVRGKIIKTLNVGGYNLVISFADCTVRYEEQVLFEPSWGVFDMAVGEKIYSAFSGPADPNAFEFKYLPPKEKTHKISYSDEARKLHAYYDVLRNVRQNGDGNLKSIFGDVKNNHPNEWLLSLEILEALKSNGSGSFVEEVKSHLNDLVSQKPDLGTLINNGLKLLDKE